MLRAWNSASASAHSAASSAAAIPPPPRHQLVEALSPVLQPLLLPYVLHGGAEFDNTDSYQSRALDRLALQTSATSFSDAKLVQYYVLYCILEATNGRPNVLTSADYRFDNFDETNFPEWTSTDGWLALDQDPCGNNSTNTTNSNNSTYAPWYGITCDDLGRVTEVSLVKNLMTGHFPPEIKLLAGDGNYSTSGAGDLNLLEVFDNEFLFNNFDNTWMTDLGSNLGK
jgi:hypothetical protein